MYAMCFIGTKFTHFVFFCKTKMTSCLVSCSLDKQMHADAGVAESIRHWSSLGVATSNSEQLITHIVVLCSEVLHNYANA